MFGGLEIKGDSKKEEKSANSGFSFLNAAAPAPEPAPAPAASGFSFLSSAPAPALVPSKEPAPAQSPPGSGFSFMSSAPATPKEDPTPAPAQAASGFSFMSSTPAAAPEPPKPSGFSFMDSSNKPDLPVTTSSPSTAVGAGVTFGGASVAQKKPIKRRSRGIKVGGGRGDAAVMAATAGVLPAPSSLPSYEVPTPAPAPAPASIGNLKADAEDASRRAEEFMKLQEQSRITPSITPPSEEGLRAPTSSLSIEKDEELEEARRAAEEAKAYLKKESDQKEQQQQQKSAFSWFTKKDNNNSKRSAWGSRDNSQNVSAANSTDELPAPHELEGIPGVGGSVADGTMDLQQGPMSEAERIAKEQEEIKRAMAERHNAMQLQMDDSSNRSVSGGGIFSKPRQTVELPPPPPSPQEILDRILKNFAQEADRSMNKVLELRQQRNMLLDERFVALAKERLAMQQISQAEAQQLAAAEQEDFDLADRLQVVIDGLSRERGETKAILDNLSKALDMLETQTPAVIQRVSDCFQQVEIGLKEFKEQQTKVERYDDNEAMARFSATAKQLSAEEERLKSELKHLERDAEQASEERKELDNAILENTSDLEQEREKAADELTKTEKEIMDLKEQLRQKETEAAQLRSTLTTYDQDINKILLKFTRQITRVQKKEASLKENRREWENEQKAYESLKDAHEAEVKAHSEALLQHNIMMDDIKKEIGFACTFRYIVSEEVNFDDARKDGDDDEELAQLQADVVKSEASFTEASTLLKAAEANLVELDGERKRLEARVPKLEAQKKSAAAKRDFKTAGKASKEIKEAAARLEQLEADLLNEAHERRAKAQAEVSRVQKEMEATKAKADAKERESGIVQMDKVAEKIRHLIAVKKKGCSGELSSNGVQAVASMILKGQINALKLEGEAYGEKFGGWDAIAATLEDEDLDSTKGGNEPSGEGADQDIGVRGSDDVNPESVRKGRDLTKRLTEAEAALEAAVGKEDYDKAAEMDEVLKELQKEVEALNLTDAETDLVMDEDAEIPEPEIEEEAVSEEKTKENTEGPCLVEKEGTEREVETEDEIKDKVKADAETTEEKEAEVKEEVAPAEEEAPKEEETDDIQESAEGPKEEAGKLEGEDEKEAAKSEQNGGVHTNGTDDKPSRENGETESDDREEFFDAEEAEQVEAKAAESSVA